MLDEDIDGGGGLWHVDDSRENGIIHVCNLKMAFIGIQLGDTLYLERETVEGWEWLKEQRKIPADSSWRPSPA
jgi:hypothetical protein